MHWTCCDTASFSEEELQSAFAEMSPSRKEYIHSLRQSKDKARSIAAELLVLQLLEESFGITNAQLHRKENGQPYLTGCDLYVSITHCEGKIACVISHDPVGIDLERIRPVDLKLCRHVCVAEEKAYVLGDCREYEERECQDQEVLRRFFEIWTGKEAYFKKIGTGVTNLKSVNVLTLPRQIHLVENYMVQIL